MSDPGALDEGCPLRLGVGIGGEGSCQGYRVVGERGATVLERLFDGGGEVGAGERELSRE